MKKLLIVAIIATSLPASADEAITCEQLSELYGSAMKNRQAGAELGNILRIFDGSDAEKMLHNMVIQAYKKPQYSAAAYRAKAVVDFKNDGLIACLEASQ